MNKLHLSIIESLRKHVKLLCHLLFWLFYLWVTIDFFVTWLPANGIEAPLLRITLYSLAYMIVMAAVAYLNHFYFFPRFFLRNEYKLYAIIILGSIILAIFIKVNLDVLALPIKAQWAYSWAHYSSSILPFVFILIVNTLSLLIGARFGQLKNEKDLKNANLETELKWLRSQINPHFLFNTLNNLYTLVYFKSDDAPRHILQLSDMMRYILEESNHSLVPLTKEINFMKNFINLQKLRFEDLNKVNFQLSNYSEEIDIPPLLFINFIENSFKHGNLDQDYGYVNINLTITSNEIDFKVINSFSNNSNKDKIIGIGIENVKHRLQLLYPQKHKISIQSDQQVFTVHLKIYLK